MVLCFYVLLFAVELILLVCAVRSREKNLWPTLFGLEIFSALGAAGLMFLFDALPGHGKAPGLTWFAEVFCSLFAAVGYGLMFALSLLVWLIWMWRKGR